MVQINGRFGLKFDVSASCGEIPFSSAQMDEADLPSPTRSVVSKAEFRISEGKRWLYSSSNSPSYMQEKGD
jgi:hypothetical protein